ncbi:MAG: hypothetical protein K1X29_08925 [Bdellovibrionales bacterium]|nr:hypothetical protein [Bdellovibrionales bacterium]
MIISKEKQKKFTSVIVLLSMCFFSKPSSSKWDNKSEKAFISIVCSKDSYFRNCFTDADGICQGEFKKILNECLNTTSFKKGGRTPAQINQNKVKNLYAIGLCSGSAYEKKWQNKKINSLNCKNINLWR